MTKISASDAGGAELSRLSGVAEDAGPGEPAATVAAESDPAEVQAERPLMMASFGIHGMVRSLQFEGTEFADEQPTRLDRLRDSLPPNRREGQLRSFSAIGGNPGALTGAFQSPSGLILRIPEGLSGDTSIDKGKDFDGLLAAGLTRLTEAKAETVPELTPELVEKAAAGDEQAIAALALYVDSSRLEDGTLDPAKMDALYAVMKDLPPQAFEDLAYALEWKIDDEPDFLEVTNALIDQRAYKDPEFVGRGLQAIQEGTYQPCGYGDVAQNAEFLLCELDPALLPEALGKLRELGGPEAVASVVSEVMAYGPENAVVQNLIEALGQPVAEGGPTFLAEILADEKGRVHLQQGISKLLDAPGSSGSEGQEGLETCLTGLVLATGGDAVAKATLASVFERELNGDWSAANRDLTTERLSKAWESAELSSTDVAAMEDIDQATSTYEAKLGEARTLKAAGHEEEAQTLIAEAGADYERAVLDAGGRLEDENALASIVKYLGRVAAMQEEEFGVYTPATPEVEAARDDFAASDAFGDHGLDDDLAATHRSAAKFIEAARDQEQEGRTASVQDHFLAVNNALGLAVDTLRTT